MDDKARFQNTLTQLEQHLYDYKKCFPKNVWQILSTDMPTITLIVVAYITIKLIGFNLASIIIIGVILATIIFVRIVNDSSAWKQLMEQRGKYQDELNNIKDQINKIDIKDFKQYPDVNNYLNTFYQELNEETTRKKNIKKRYYIISFGIYSIILIAILLTFKIDFRNTVTNKYYDGRIYNSLHITKEQPIAIIKPLSVEAVDIISETNPGTKGKNLYLFFEERSSSADLITYRPNLDKIKYPRLYNLRITITDKSGHPVIDLPIFDINISYYYQRGNEIISSQPITSEYENHPYEIIRRVRYLQENAKDLRYVIEGF